MSDDFAFAYRLEDAVRMMSAVDIGRELVAELRAHQAAVDARDFEEASKHRGHLLEVLDRWDQKVGPAAPRKA